MTRHLLLFLALAIFTLAGALARTDPETSRVRVIMLGEISTGNEQFLQWVEDNPKFTLRRIACDINVAGSVREGKRLVRVYMPRTEEKLFNEIDAAVFEDFTPQVIAVEHLDWFQNSVEKGMGIALIEYVNWGGTNDIHMWMALRFYELFPADVYLNDIPALAGRTYYDVINEDGPLALPGIEKTPMNVGHHGDLDAREGSQVEALWKGRRTPAMVTATYGEGRTLQLGHGWDNTPSRDYRYMPDYIFNTLLCISGVPYPEDLELVHDIRSMFISYSFRRRGTMAVLEFVEKFGANPFEAESSLSAMEADYREASRLYLEADFERSAEVLDGLIERFSDVDRELIEAKDRALLWVYVIEWTTVTAVGLICGSILWMLMVRRELYRGVAATRVG